jgi:hypothetical protein
MSTAASGMTNPLADCAYVARGLSQFLGLT